MLYGQETFPDPDSRPVGVTWWPSDAEESVLDAYRTPHVITDPWAERIEIWAEKQDRAFASADALACALGIELGKIGRRETLRVVAVLRRLGYDCILMNGRKRWARKQGPRSPA